MIPKVGTQNESNRIAWVEKALKQIPAGARILDAGAGERKFKGFCSHLNYVAQDFAQYDGRGDGKGLQMGSWDQTRLDIISDITSIPEPDRSFDAIMCIEVFEHLPNPLLAIAEFTRLLKKGGQLIMTAPFCSLTHFAPIHFFTGFNRYFYEIHLPAFGYDIIEIQENGNFFEYIAQEIRRIPTVAKRYTGCRLHIWDFGAIYLVLNMLDRVTRKDKGSAEILHFGCFVKAIKK